jgi:hypothetical protein
MPFDATINLPTRTVFEIYVRRCIFYPSSHILFISRGFFTLIPLENKSFQTFTQKDEFLQYANINLLKQKKCPFEEITTE